MYYGNDGLTNTPGLDTTFSDFEQTEEEKWWSHLSCSSRRRCWRIWRWWSARSSPDPNYAGKAGSNIVHYHTISGPAQVKEIVVVL